MGVSVILDEGDYKLANQVATALEGGQPVVALESSFLAQGLPQPQNLEAARAMMSAVREAGAVPAMIGVVKGQIHVGLDEAVLTRFSEDTSVRKASASDLGILVSLGRDGATTVSGTLLVAAKAGIAVMATGGIGGVHRGAEKTFDVSADIRALATYPLAVVCSGVKSILDLPKTLEVLETEGVPIVGYRSDCLPGFYQRETELSLEHRVDTVSDAATVISTHCAVGRGGLVIANPCPLDVDVPAELLEQWARKAEADARAEGVRGKAETPFLLRRIGELSEGRTLTANMALLVANARLAARIAAVLA